MEAEVLANRALAPEIYELLLKAPAVAEKALPGQFVHVRTGVTLLRRPFSLWRIEPPVLGLLFRVVGEGTAWLAARRPGEALDILGPLGHGFPLDGEGPLVLAAGGMGLAPLGALAAFSRHRPMTALLGFRDASRRVGLEAFAAAGCHVVHATEETATALDLLREHLSQELPAEVAACGPRPFLAGVLELTGAVPRVSLSLEERLACGVGACLGCSHGGIKICRDGPVLDREEVKRFWS